MAYDTASLMTPTGPWLRGPRRGLLRNYGARVTPAAAFRKLAGLPLVAAATMRDYDSAVAQTLHLAVVDDERAITSLLARYMSGHGFRVSQLHSGAELMALMVSDEPAAVLLDLGLPGEDGLAIARQLREHWACALLIVTARNEPVDKVVGLEVGADDYVTKPFDMRELLARIRAVLRRLSPAKAELAPVVVSRARTLAFAGWTLDVSARVLCNPQGDDVPLTTGEFELLTVFVRNPGRALSRDFLIAQTRGREAGPLDRTIDVQVGRLRRKLDTVDGPQQFVKSIRGVGYIFVPKVEAL